MDPERVSDSHDPESKNAIDDVGRGFRRGDAESVERVRARVRKILGFRGFRMSAEDRKDLEQEVMTQVWQAVNRPSFRLEGGFWGFIETVCARRCIDWLRRTKPVTDQFPDLAEKGPGPLERILAGERRKTAYAALGGLGEACKELVYLHAGIGLSYHQIADLLGKSEGALRVQMHRCIKQARRRVERMQSSARSGAADGDF